MSATMWGTNLYVGEPVGDVRSMIDCGRYTRIHNVQFDDGVSLLAAPDVPAGEVIVMNCLFEGRVVYTSNVRFEHCYFRAGKPEMWQDDLAGSRPPEGTT